MIIEPELSKEEVNLYNPAYVGVILYQSIRQCSENNQKGLHCSLLYLIAPLALCARYSSVLPASVSTPIAGWASDCEGSLVGFANSVSAFIMWLTWQLYFYLKRRLFTYRKMASF